MKTARSWTSKSLSDEIAEASTRGGVDDDGGGPARHRPGVRRKLNRSSTGIAPEQRKRNVSTGCGSPRLCGIQGTTSVKLMIRLALALRADWITTWSLQNIECPRFPGELDDYVYSMERLLDEPSLNVS